MPPRHQHRERAPHYRSARLLDQACDPGFCRSLMRCLRVQRRLRLEGVSNVTATCMMMRYKPVTASMCDAPIAGPK